MALSFTENGKMKGLTVFWELNKISESMIRPKLKRQENTIDKKKGERVHTVKYYVTLWIAKNQ